MKVSQTYRVALIASMLLILSFGMNMNSVSKPYPPAPLGNELRPDTQGFLTATRKGIAEDMAQDLPKTEQQILIATQGQAAAAEEQICHEARLR